MMDSIVNEWLDQTSSIEDSVRLKALQNLLRVTEVKVDWVYEAWDALAARLDHENSYQRSIAIMLLCNLTKSDEKNCLEADIDRLLAHTRDEKFITSRQCIQNIWKAAAAHPALAPKIIAHLERTFHECARGPHPNLIRQDILQSLALLAASNGDESLLARAKALIEAEPDEKYRKKYASVLKAPA
jgi:hypothetical protein